jgi:heavy metal sensor kinase
MSFAKAPSFWRLLAFRLTLLYGGVLVASALVCFLISYLLVSSAMQSRTDVDLLREAAYCAQSFQQGGLPALKKRIDVEAPAIGTNDIFFLVYGPNAKPLTSSDLSTWDDLTPPSSASPPSGSRFDNAFGRGHHAKLRVLTYAMPDGKVLQIGITVQDDVRVIEQARRIAAIVMIGLIAVAVALGWFMAKRALAGVQRVTNTANEITRDALARRVPTSGSGDEVDELATTINRMLDRIQTLVEDMQATNDNIAHELRSPITRMRGLAETTLTGRSSAREYQEMAASTIEECDRLLAVINTMLDIAEAEAGVMKLEIAPFDIVPVIQQACEFYEPMTAEKQLQMHIDVPETAAVNADVRKIQRVVANLLDNAVKYTPKGGKITISIARRGSEVQFGISNSGPHISAKDLPNIFKRFYRGDASRSGPGNGLGLSLAQAIICAHGGQIAVRSTPDEPSIFTVNLPAAQNIPISVA